MLWHHNRKYLGSISIKRLHSPTQRAQDHRFAVLAYIFHKSHELENRLSVQIPWEELGLPLLGSEEAHLEVYTLTEILSLISNMALFPNSLHEMVCAGVTREVNFPLAHPLEHNLSSARMYPFF